MTKFVTPSFRLDGKRALVTGGSKGIGLAAAHALAQAGANVMIVARGAPDLILASAEIHAGVKNGTAIVEHKALNVQDSAAVDVLFASSAPFDIVINNAGTNRPKALEDTSDEDIDAVLDLNIKAALYVLRAASKSMKTAQLRGSIVNISSQMGHVGSPHRTLYCASKHALEGATKALAWELGAYGIRVNTICPTFIETPLTAPMLSKPGFKEFVLSKIALGRLGQLEEVMGAVVFLASDASSLMTGSALMLDGGWTAS